MNVVKLNPQATFEDFWKACPRKVGKPLTQAKWNAITNGGLKTKTLDRDSGEYVEIFVQATPEELVAAMKRYDKSLRSYKHDGDYGSLKDDERFIPHPATWLNQGRWMD